jgi:hypothetical protein
MQKTTPMTHLLLAQKFIQHPPQNRLQSSRDDIERDVVFDAKVVEREEVGIDLKRSLHILETILEWDFQATPHLLGDIPK